MKGITICRPSTAVLNDDAIVMSPYSVLCSLFCEELLSRIRHGIGRYQPVDLQFLMEGGDDEATAPLPVEYHIDLNLELLLQFLKKAAHDTESFKNGSVSDNKGYKWPDSVAKKERHRDAAVFAVRESVRPDSITSKGRKDERRGSVGDRREGLAGSGEDRAAPGNSESERLRYRDALNYREGRRDASDHRERYRDTEDSRDAEKRREGRRDASDHRERYRDTEDSRDAEKRREGRRDASDHRERYRDTEVSRDAEKRREGSRDASDHRERYRDMEVSRDAEKRPEGPRRVEDHQKQYRDVELRQMLFQGGKDRSEQLRDTEEAQERNRKKTIVPALRKSGDQEAGKDNYNEHKGNKGYIRNNGRPFEESGPESFKNHNPLFRHIVERILGNEVFFTNTLTLPENARLLRREGSDAEANILKLAFDLFFGGGMERNGIAGKDGAAGRIYSVLDNVVRGGNSFSRNMALRHAMASPGTRHKLLGLRPYTGFSAIFPKIKPGPSVSASIPVGSYAFKPLEGIFDNPAYSDNFVYSSYFPYTDYFVHPNYSSHSAYAGHPAYADYPVSVDRHDLSTRHDYFAQHADYGNHVGYKDQDNHAGTFSLGVPGGNGYMAVRDMTASGKNAFIRSLLASIPLRYASELSDSPDAIMRNKSAALAMSFVPTHTANRHPAAAGSLPSMKTVSLTEGMLMTGGSGTAHSGLGGQDGMVLHPVLNRIGMTSRHTISAREKSALSTHDSMISDRTGGIAGADLSIGHFILPEGRGAKTPRDKGYGLPFVQPGLPGNGGAKTPRDKGYGLPFVQPGLPGNGGAKTPRDKGYGLPFVQPGLPGNGGAKTPRDKGYGLPFVQPGLPGSRGAKTPSDKGDTAGFLLSSYMKDSSDIRTKRAGNMIFAVEKSYDLPPLLLNQNAEYSQAAFFSRNEAVKNRPEDIRTGLTGAFFPLVQRGEFYSSGSASVFDRSAREGLGLKDSAALPDLLKTFSIYTPGAGQGSLALQNKLSNSIQGVDMFHNNAAENMPGTPGAVFASMTTPVGSDIMALPEFPANRGREDNAITAQSRSAEAVIGMTRGKSIAADNDTARGMSAAAGIGMTRGKSIAADNDTARGMSAAAGIGMTRGKSTAAGIDTVQGRSAAIAFPAKSGDLLPVRGVERSRREIVLLSRLAAVKGSHGWIPVKNSGPDDFFPGGIEAGRKTEGLQAASILLPDVLAARKDAGNDFELLFASNQQDEDSPRLSDVRHYWSPGAGSSSLSDEARFRSPGAGSSPLSAETRFRSPDAGSLPSSGVTRFRSPDAGSSSPSDEMSFRSPDAGSLPSSGVTRFRSPDAGSSSLSDEMSFRSPDAGSSPLSYTAYPQPSDTVRPRPLDMVYSIPLDPTGLSGKGGQEGESGPADSFDGGGKTGKDSSRAPLAGMENLPLWARELLGKRGNAYGGDGAFAGTQTDYRQGNAEGGMGASASAPASSGIPFSNPSVGKAGGSRVISWTAPGLPGQIGRPQHDSMKEPVRTEFRQVAGKDGWDGKPFPGRPSFSEEAEIRRMADKVYHILEDRLRRELRRSGQ